MRNFSLCEGAMLNCFVMFILGLSDSAERQINVRSPVDTSRAVAATQGSLSFSQDCLGIKFAIHISRQPAKNQELSPDKVLSSTSPPGGLLFSKNAGDALAHASVVPQAENETGWVEWL